MGEACVASAPFPSLDTSPRVVCGCLVVSLAPGVGMSIPVEVDPTSGGTTPPMPPPVDTRDVYFRGGRQSTALYKLESLSPGHALRGPAIIIDKTATILVTPGFEARITEHGDVRVVASRCVCHARGWLSLMHARRLCHALTRW